MTKKQYNSKTSAIINEVIHNRDRQKPKNQLTKR